MKVYLPAIEGHVPPGIVRMFSAFLDFCYYARRNSLNEDALDHLQDALERFHKHRCIFQEKGVRECGPKGFSLPRQHSMNHYQHLIQEFGAPNGLCSSITESKHIKAVKKPWRRSNRFNALGQMLLTNQRLDKLAAARVDFKNRGMLQGSVLSAAMGEVEVCSEQDHNPDASGQRGYGSHSRQFPSNDRDSDDGSSGNDTDEEETQAQDDQRILNYVRLAKTPCMSVIICTGVFSATDPILQHANILAISMHLPTILISSNQCSRY